MAISLRSPHFKLIGGCALLLCLAWLVATQPLTWLGLATGAVAGTIFLLRWPWLIWPIIGAALPVAAGFKVGPLSLLDLLLLAAAALWLVDGTRRRTLRFDFTPVTIAVLIFALFQWLSSLNAPNLGEASAEVIKWLEFAVVLLLVRQMAAPQHSRWLVAGVLLGAISQALLGLYQFFYQIGPEWFIILGRFMRASGAFRQPNPYAGYLGLCLPVALSLTLWGWSELSTRMIGFSRGAPATTSRREGRFTRHGSLVAWTLFYTTCTLLIAAGILASWSRGGWLGAGAGVITVLVLYSRKMAVTFGLIALILLVALLIGALSPGVVPDALTARVGDLPAYFGLGDVLNQEVNDDNFAVIERVAHWKAAIRMWESAPWLGIGPGNYATLYPTVRLPQWEEPLGHAHNIYLNVLGESGLVGFAAFCLLWGVALAWIVQRRRIALQGHDHWAGAFTVGVLGVLAHLAVHNLFDNLFVQGLYIQVAVWLAVVDLSTGALTSTMEKDDNFLRAPHQSAAFLWDKS